MSVPSDFNQPAMPETIKARAYTRGWRARRDGKGRDALTSEREWAGWDDADCAASMGRDIEWSKPSKGWLEVPL